MGPLKLSRSSLGMGEVPSLWTFQYAKLAGVFHWGITDVSISRSFLYG